MNKYLKHTLELIALLSVTMTCACRYTGKTKTSLPETITAEESGFSADSADETESAAVTDSADFPETQTGEVETSSQDSAAAENPASSGTAETTATPRPNEIPLTTDEPYYVERVLTNAEQELAAHSLFVGDSICRGFDAYSVIPSQNVFAKGNTAAWSFEGFSMFRAGEKVDYFDYLQSFKPDNVFYWMGMNDINMGSREDFCNNYKAVIDRTLEKSDAEIYVCAITPIIAECEFSTNEKINSYNEAIKKFISEKYTERVHFISFAGSLKNSSGNMNPQFNGGDGIHLNPDAYYVILKVITKELGNS